MGKPGRPGPTLDDYLYWQERLENRVASGLSIDEFCTVAVSVRPVHDGGPLGARYMQRARR